MEELKPINEIFITDKRNEDIYRISSPNNVKYLEFKDYYDQVANYNLNTSVPSNVISYFETIRNLFIYGWYYYLFYTIARGLTFMCIELALKEKFKVKNGYLKKLLRRAIKEKIIQVEKLSYFSNIKKIKIVEKAPKEITTESSAMSTEEYANFLLDSIPALRNFFAHPYGQLLPPAAALSSIQISTELINQIFSNED
jgi:hypothetical protein